MKSRNVQAEGWGAAKNGRLLALAAEAGFMALISCDQGMEHQQNPSKLPMPIVILRAPTNTLEDLAPHMALVIPALEETEGPCFVVVST